MGRGRSEEALGRRFDGLGVQDAAQLVAMAGLGEPTESVDHESWENRVFSYLAGGRRWVVKLYWPGRWSRAALEDELGFVMDLVQAGVATPEPVDLGGGNRLGTWKGFHYVILPFVEGAEDQNPMTQEQVRHLGRLAARIHQVGATRPALNRPQWDPVGHARGCLARVLEQDFAPATHVSRLQQLVEQLLPALARAGTMPAQRIHADLHFGNVVWTASDQPVVLDFDDFEMAPCVVDLWLATYGYAVEGIGAAPGRAEDLAGFVVHRDQVWRLFLEGYRELRAFDNAQLAHVDALGLLRFMFFWEWYADRSRFAHFRSQIGPEVGTAPWWTEQLDAFATRVDALG